MTDLHLADSVLARIVQIIQEGMLLGVDVSDLMRQIKLKQSTLDPTSLILTDEYVASINQMHVHLVEEAERLQTLGETPVEE